MPSDNVVIKAIYSERVENSHSATWIKLDERPLPQGKVSVAVEHSTLNYKDALAITGKGPVVRTFPMVPGIDFAGRATSRDPRLTPGSPSH